MFVTVGTYVGTGIAFKIQLTFKPKVILTWTEDEGSPDHLGWKTTDMSGAFGINAFSAGTGLADNVCTIEDDGFTVGTAIIMNRNTDVYYWMAVGGSDVFVTSYVGTGLDDRPLTGFGFKPDYVMIKRDGGLPVTDSVPFYTLKSNIVGEAMHWGDVGFFITGAIKTLEADGVTLGTRSDVNKSGEPYFLMAFKETPGVFEQGSYTGTGIARTIFLNDAALTPVVVSCKISRTTSGNRNVKHINLAGNLSFILRAGDYNPGTLDITEVGQLGEFKVGIGSLANRSGFAVHYTAFDATAAPPIVPAPAPIPVDRTETDIINDALGQIGARRITLLSSGEPNANFALCFYATLRDDLLRLSHWRFATGRAHLPQDATTPAFEFAFQYTLPADFIKLREYNGANTDTTNLSLFERSQIPRFKVEGRKLLTNDGEVKIVYTKRITNPNLFDPMFYQTLSTWLASKLADAITKDREKSDSLVTQALEVLLPMAAAVDGQEGSVEPYRSDDLIIGR